MEVVVKRLPIESTDEEVSAAFAQAGAITNIESRETRLVALSLPHART